MLRRTVSGNSRGYTLMEQIIALALVVIAVTALLQALSGGISNMRKFSDRARLVNLARSQMESIQSEAYQDAAASYTQIGLPPGYSLDIVAAVPRSYTYPSPDITPTANVIQQITINVYSPETSFELVGYRANR